MLKLSLPPFLRVFLPTVSLAYARAHNAHTQIPSRLPSTSFRSLRCTQRPIYYSPAYKVSYKGKWSVLAERERKEGNLCNSRVHNLSVLVSGRVEVSWGQEVFLASIEASFAVDSSSSAGRLTVDPFFT